MMDLKQRCVEVILGAQERWSKFPPEHPMYAEPMQSVVAQALIDAGLVGVAEWVKVEDAQDFSGNSIGVCSDGDGPLPVWRKNAEGYPWERMDAIGEYGGQPTHVLRINPAAIPTKGEGVKE